MTSRSVFGAALITLSLPTLAPAQQISLMAGRAEYDLSGVHTSNVWAARVAFPAEPFFAIEPGLSYIHTSQDFGRTDLWMPEIQLQAHALLGPLAPYLGVGVGAAIDDPDDDPNDAFEDPEPEIDFTSSVAAGIKVGLTQNVGIRVEGRLRGIELEWIGTVTELTAGIVIGG
jgi:hypothetical protein